MTYTHTAREHHVGTLGALAHPDGTTRVQTLEQDEDPELHSILADFTEPTGIPALVNTSMNGANQPTVESPDEALEISSVPRT
jgi:carbamoyltransferase